MPLASTPDHVAAVVPDLAAADERWGRRLGAGNLMGSHQAAFRNHQYEFRGGAVLELLAPPSGDGDRFVSGFLDRFGAQVHHVTLKVPDLREALATLEAAGLDAVDVDLSDDRWHEAFVRPSHVGGLIVQVAATTMAASEWIALTGFPRTPPADDAARLLGPLLQHPDLDRASTMWATLGGTVSEVDTDLLEVAWADAPLTVQVRRGDTAGPVGLRFADTPPLPADPDLGPAVLAAAATAAVE